jgi:hypothetical protein
LAIGRRVDEEDVAKPDAVTYTLMMTACAKVFLVDIIICSHS